MVSSRRIYNAHNGANTKETGDTRSSARACACERAESVERIMCRYRAAASGALLTRACLHKSDLGSGRRRRRRRRSLHISARPQVGITYARAFHAPCPVYIGTPKSEPENLFPPSLPLRGPHRISRGGHLRNTRALDSGEHSKSRGGKGERQRSSERECEG